MLPRLRLFSPVTYYTALPCVAVPCHLIAPSPSPDLFSSLTSSSVGGGCPGRCYHALAALMCDRVLEGHSCPRPSMRCCAGPGPLRPDATVAPPPAPTRRLQKTTTTAAPPTRRLQTPTTTAAPPTQPVRARRGALFLREGWADREEREERV